MERLSIALMAPDRSVAIDVGVTRAGSSIRHQAWRSGTAIPPHLRAWRESFTSLHPGWDLRLDDDAHNRALVASFCPGRRRQPRRDAEDRRTAARPDPAPPIAKPPPTGLS